jgi:catechol 2,3-dioxygenase-like lactoylglutathione lyase family enzyme
VALGTTGMKKGAHGGNMVSPVVERTDFVSVPVTDLEKSTAWYRETLGLPQISEGGWPEFQLGENVSLYLIDLANVGREFTEPHSAYIALRVPDVEEARTELEGRGIEFEGDIFDTGVCHMAFFHDPDGNSLMLHRRYAPRD